MQALEARKRDDLCSQPEYPPVRAPFCGLLFAWAPAYLSILRFHLRLFPAIDRIQSTGVAGLALESAFS